jgi:intracellular multiplication protein IcmK
MQSTRFALFLLTFFAPTVVLAQTTSSTNAGQTPAPGTSVDPAHATSVAPGLPLPPLPDTSKAAFDAMKKDMMPLTPDQIRQLRSDIDDEDRAAAAPPKFVPKPVSSSLRAVMSPGATPPVVRLFANFETSVLFIDEAGRALNIEAVDVPGRDSKAGVFNVTWATDSKSQTNVLTISPNSQYAMGNIQVHLAGVMAPVTVMLISGQHEVDTRADVRVSGVGSSIRGDTLPSGADESLQAFLDGVPPQGAKPLTSSLASVQVWSLGGQFIVKTGPDLSVVSPAYLQSKSSPDGTTVYVEPAVSPLMALSQGQPVNIQISGY